MAVVCHRLTGQSVLWRAVDESDADDGAIFKFWDFILERRRQRKPEFDLTDLAQLAEAIDEFEATH
jgi:hypothetical protein